jgi:hypothetical protein
MMTPYTKILIANRGDNGRMAVAAKPNCAVRAAHEGEFDPIEAADV